MIVKHMAQGSELWFEARRGIPTASNFSRIITASKGDLSKAATDYIAELLAELHHPGSLMPDAYVSPAMTNGIQLEPEARRWYCMERDCEVQQVGLCLTDDGRFGCSPDAIVGEHGLLELKCPAPKTQAAYLLAGKLPDEYKQQVHGQLWVTGRKWVDFVSYCPRFPTPFVLRIEPDEYTQRLGVALTLFWHDYNAAHRKIFGCDLPKRSDDGQAMACQER